MCDAEGNGLESLMGVFRLPNADVRVGLKFVPSLSFNLCKYLGAGGFFVTSIAFTIFYGG